eukprot:9006074-Alexandrium_andersonii.AAC.1
MPEAPQAMPARTPVEAFARSPDDASSASSASGDNSSESGDTPADDNDGSGFVPPILVDVNAEDIS